VRRDLRALAGREWDVVVVGGGIHGAAAAREAASRGLSTALVEARDFGSGASWNSLKTIHGGLRHLQRLDLRSLRESARERAALLRTAPELVRPLPFVVPTYGHGARGREVMAFGLWLGELLAGEGAPAVPRSRTLTPAEVRARYPEVGDRGLSGGVEWHDAQVDSSERLTLAVLHAACAAGAEVANHAEVVGLRPRQGGHEVEFRDHEGGETLVLQARTVLNAAGAWIDRILGLAGREGTPVPLLRAVNLVLRRPLTRGCAVGLRGDDGRYVFVVPWRDRSMAGTAYGPRERSFGELARSFLEELRRAAPWAGLAEGDVALVHGGLVPGSGSAAGLWTRSRIVDHEMDGLPGLLSLVGVKYTTARALAEVAVDRVLRRLRRPPSPSGTARAPLPHARALAGSLEERTRVAMRDEQACHLTDAVLGRLDLGTAGPPDEADLARVGDTMASELGWEEGRRSRERHALLARYGLDPAIESP
jgi:glycerol-3-phosphate dehydrogenase